MEKKFDPHHAEVSFHEELDSCGHQWDFKGKDVAHYTHDMCKDANRALEQHIQRS